MSYMEAEELVAIADESGKIIKAHGFGEWHELTLEQAIDWLDYERDHKSKITIDGNLIKFKDGEVWISINDAKTQGDK